MELTGPQDNPNHKTRQANLPNKVITDYLKQLLYKFKGKEFFRSWILFRNALIFCYKKSISKYAPTIYYSVNKIGYSKLDAKIAGHETYIWTVDVIWHKRCWKMEAQRQRSPDNISKWHPFSFKIKKIIEF